MLIYITGGARSGKSRFAQDLARTLAKRVVFVATSEPSDDDMRTRIKRHREDRPKHWRTIEDRLDLWALFSELKGQTDLVLIDCLNMYVAGRMVAGEKEKQIEERVEKLCRAAADSKLKVILVSNEVGSGVHPTSEWGRRFRDDLGRANQIAAQFSKKAYLMVSGLPLFLKGGPK